MVTKKIKGLGRGLEALLGPTVNEAPTAADDRAPSTLSLDVMVAGVYQPRTRMDEGSLYELAESIKAQGIMQPILVRMVHAGAHAVRILCPGRLDRFGQHHQTGTRQPQP